MILHEEIGPNSSGQIGVWAGENGLLPDIEDARWVYQTDGLVGKMPDGVLVYSSTDYGDCHLTVESYTNAPPVDALLPEWDELSEIDLPVNSPDGYPGIAIGELTGGGDARFDLPAGLYRLRVAARNRDPALTAEDCPPIGLLLQLWRVSEPSEHVTLKHSDLTGWQIRQFSAQGLGVPLPDEPEPPALPYRAR